MKLHGLVLIISTVFLILSCGGRRNAELAYQKSLYNTLSLEQKREPGNAILALETHHELEVSLFASEPMVSNPTNIDIDARGRVWVCEAYNYGLMDDQVSEPGGRISILEDTDGDGKADKKTVFYQGEDVNIALGIAVLGNKVYVTRSPHLLVFTDEDGDDSPDKKEIMFTGMGEPGDHSAHALIAGPDGRLYFNYGNMGRKVLEPDGSPVVDNFGNEVKSDGKPYHGGMIFRCNPDGSDFEVLAHNFRNNYEVTVDSYGNLWQSDNDDDGNESCRINFILEYGNYGYLDEMTGEHWSVPRTGQHPDIPQRHWHQNDPGVVPNLLITGAGSPAGICFYEGDLLPEIFRNQMIHTDAGPNVVRSYPVKKEGAGYRAGIENILWSEKDKWFRPVDVAVAPDGSLMVADWYDPIVGGAAVGDMELRGRIYRVSPRNQDYDIGFKAVETISGAIEALKSPNRASQYQGQEFLMRSGTKAEKSLKRMWNGKNPVFRARALWLLGKIPGSGMNHVLEALKDPDEDIRVAAIRLAVQIGIPFDNFVPGMISDPSAQVLRTLALSIAPMAGPEKAAWWTELADQYDGKDRWYLEALGISASNQWQECYDSWYSADRTLEDKKSMDIVWRSRAPGSIKAKTGTILNTISDSMQIERMFRSFDFLNMEEKNTVLLSMLGTEHPYNDLIVSLVIQHIDPEETEMSGELMAAIRQTLEKVNGTQDFISIIDRYGLAAYRDELMDLALNAGFEEMGYNAMKVLIENQNIRGLDLVKNRIESDPLRAETIVQLLGPLSTRNSLDLLRQIIRNRKIPLSIRRAAIQGLGQSWWGEEYLMDMVRDGHVEDALKPAAASVLFSVYRADIREEAAEYLNKPGLAGGTALPPIRDLLSYQGTAENGRPVFESYCQTCHRVGNEGIKFGPDLTVIGDKLSKDGLFQAIIFPNQGINNGYEGYLVRLKGGGTVSGLILSESDEEVILRQVGGFEQKIRRSEIGEIEMMDRSLMTDLAGMMTQQQLIDLVEYLNTLKASENLAAGND
jgi:putative membrane-bound dehydrogenase-like protein